SINGGVWESTTAHFADELEPPSAMSLADHTIAIYEGEERTLADWGIEKAVLTTNAGADDRLVLSVVADYDSEPLFSADQVLYLKSPDGTVRFSGRPTVYGGEASAGGERATIEVLSPWADLQLFTAVEPWNFADDPTAYASAVSQRNMPRIFFTRYVDGTL